VSGPAILRRQRRETPEEPAPEQPADHDSAAETVLFRSEAVDYAERRLQGDVILASPIHLKIYGALIVAIVAVAAVFVTTATYSRKETVPGWVQPEGGLIRTSALQAGVISEMLVREGDKVAAGAPIAKLKLMHDVEDGRSDDMLRWSMDAEKQAILDQLTTRRQTLLDDRKERVAELTALKESLKEAKYREQLAADRLALSEADHKRKMLLNEAGAYATSLLESSLSTVLTNQSSLSQSRTSTASVEQQIERMQHQLEDIPVQLAGMEAQAQITQAQLAQRVTNAAAQATYIVTAPMAGEILAVPVELGQVVPSGGTIAVLAPEGSRLIADLYVPSRAAGFIKENQEVRVKYQAFPHEKFGAAKGKVIRVSNTVLGPRETAIPGVELKEPVFRVRVKLDELAVSAYGESIPIQPGMLLDADIVVDRRSLLEWLLDPIYAVGGLR
jgi:membrane fusion protein